MNRSPPVKSLLIVLALLFPCCAWADGVTPLTLEEPPLGYRNATGELDGVSVELVRELQRRLGNSEPIRVYPWARAYRVAQTRPDILLFTVTRTQEREALFHWLLRVDRNAWILYGRRDDGLVLNSIEDARSAASIGVLRDGAHAALLSSLGFTNLVPLASYTQLLENLSKGRVKLGFYSASGFIESANRVGLDPEDFTPLLTLRTPESYIVLSKPGTTAQTLARWRQAVASIQNDGTFEQIARRWVERLSREQGFDAHFGDGALNLWPAPAATPADDPPSRPPSGSYW